MQANAVFRENIFEYSCCVATEGEITAFMPWGYLVGQRMNQVAR